MKRTLSIVFILTANLILLAHAIVPHHHHHNKLFFDYSENIQINESHGHEHDHDCEHNHSTCNTQNCDYGCSLREMVAITPVASDQIIISPRVKDIFFENQTPSTLICAEIIHPTVIQNKLFRLKPPIESNYSIFVSRTFGLRAPPRA